MENVREICVFAASSGRVGKQYMEAAYQLGQAFAAAGIACINGGGRDGLMRAVSDGTLDGGGRAVGIIPQFMVDNGWQYDSLSEIVVTADMHTRKQMMAQRADAVMALPGGCGTLEELLEIITWKQLGLFHKPIIILNVGGFYDHLLAMLKHCTDEQFMKRSHGNLWHVAADATDAMAILSAIDIKSDDIVESKY
ncbi:MAG TPA: TIGR00730 family Rossman fold protein [Candidatus Avimuribaculum pullicola]|nr:TIGR00730 family Rossman fold protein [Candidatus Avimuribaculum pullicola]